MVEYLDNTFLVADRDMHTIKRVSLDGTVSSFIGKDYQCMGGTGDVNDVGICSPGSIAADLSNGNVFWTQGRDIYGFNASDNQISLLYDGDSDNFGWMGGITVLNSEIYFSD